ncbi:MAG: hypothetical protein K0Q99_1922 [Clostridia bacterium]|nr:hypothetical protein [Clostridia bacterium]
MLILATWLAHLRIAEKVKERIPGIILPYLMIGSIAPDSGTPDETYRNYNPPKEITHFSSKEDEKSFIDLEAFFEKYLATSKIITRSDNTRSFLWGYYFHLIADRLWTEKYLIPNQVKYDTENHTDKDFISVMRDEIYALDFLYLKQNGNEIIQKFKEIKPDLNFFNEFKPSYIYECQKRITDYYEKEQYTLDGEYKFYDLNKIEEFVSEAAQKCIEVLL